MVVALAGDTMLGRVVNEALLRHGPAYPWGDVLPELHRAGARVVNLECVVARRGTPWGRWPKVFHFRANPVAVDALKLARIDCVALANNHVLDYGEEAFVEMLGLLEAAGIAYAGAGRNLEEARRPAVLEAGGLRLGVVAFTDNEPGWKAAPAAPGTHYLPVSPGSVPALGEGVARARAMGAELVVVSAHWGPNMRLRPAPAFREFARAVIEAGADAFYGHSAHVFQGVEVYRGRPILYDCGEFVDDYAVDPALRNDWGLLFGLEVEGGRVRRVALTPLLIDGCQVRRAAGEDLEAIAARIRELSAEMGTEVGGEGHRLWVECGEAQPRRR